MAVVRLGKGEHSGPSVIESKYQGILADLLKHRELGTPLRRRVSLGAHWVDSRESSLLRRLERGREIGR